MSKANFMVALLLCGILGEMTWSVAQQGKRETVSPQDFSDIQQLYARYDFAIDSHNAEGVAGVFTPDGEFLQPGSSDYLGHDALVNWINRGNVPVTATSIMRRHLNTNLVVTPTADGAKGAVYLLAVNVNTRPPSILGAYKYEDTLVKTSEGWRFKRRVVYADGLAEMRLPPAPAQQPNTK
jgi:hypothetical protein